jgi:hypothetical protein
VVANDNAFFMLNDLHSSISYHLTMAEVVLQSGTRLTLTPGQVCSPASIRRLILPTTSRVQKAVASVGAAYADGVSDILLGGALLPSLLDQDPRYFYKCTGTKKSRALQAISAPLIAKGDNGRWRFNYSSIGVIWGRIANALAQEFILHQITTRVIDAD